jgi:hypothetical protein
MRTWLSSEVVPRSRSRRGRSLQCRVNGRRIFELLAGRARRADTSGEGGIVGHVGGRVGTTQHLRLVSVGVGGSSGRAHRRGGTGGGLDGGRAGSWLEYGVVAQALALRLLAVAAGWA